MSPVYHKNVLPAFNITQMIDTIINFGISILSPTIIQTLLVIVNAPFVVTRHKKLKRAGT
jgi:hypothetical protein